MSNFINDCLKGSAIMHDINDYIDQWHNSKNDLSLHEFLGMTKKEYALFLNDENYLGNIITAHKNNQNVVIIIRDQMAIAARSDDTTKAKQLKNWLDHENLWP